MHKPKSRSLPVRFGEWYPLPATGTPYPRTLGDQIRELATWRRPHYSLIALLAILAIGYFIPYGAMVVTYGMLGTFIFRERPRFARLDGLAPSPLPKDHFGAEVVLRAKGVPYGRDHGVVGLADDWLIFEGRQCHFSLKPTEGRYRCDGERILVDLPTGSSVEFRFLERWYDGDDVVRQKAVSSLNTVLEWQRTACAPRGTAIYPPRKLQQDLNPMRPAYTFFYASLMVLLVNLGALVARGLAVRNLAGEGIVVLTFCLIAAGYHLLRSRRLRHALGILHQQ